MPIYEYECKTCGIIFEHTGSISAPPLTARPDCVQGSCSLRKLISRCAVIGGGTIAAAKLEASMAASANAIESARPAPAHSCTFHCNHK